MPNPTPHLAPAFLTTPCSTPDDLHAWVQSCAGLTIPRRPVCPNHNAPFDYLLHTYFEPASDVVVWAPRGGGKTALGAIATLLDLLHKPGCQVRILGGSLDQSLRMWEHLYPRLFQIAPDLIQRPRIRQLILKSGSCAAVLTQSQRAVRGLRVQKLRCDEVELFDPSIWEAAQLITRSVGAGRAPPSLPMHTAPPNPNGAVGATHASPSPHSPINSSPSPATVGAGHAPPSPIVGQAFQPADRPMATVGATHASPSPPSAIHSPISDAPLDDHPARGMPRSYAGAIEAISTLHAPFGLMQRIVDSALQSHKPLIHWCLLEVLEKCPKDRPCHSCPLHDDCRGRAKTLCSGFVSIDDAISMKQRVSRETWESEMLCRRPSLRHAVFPHFNPETHVKESILAKDQCMNGDLSLSLDFGFANPFVCLWIVRWDDKRTHVIDEYVQPGRQLSEHLTHIRQRRWGTPKLITCDPAGQGRSDQTATSNVQLLRKEGFSVRCRSSGIVDGLELIRAALSPASGDPKLFIHPRCQRLIRALQSYHYAPGGSELPVKDGVYDHLIDALRYHFVNFRFSGKVVWRYY